LSAHTRVRTVFSFSLGRRWTATGVPTSRRGPDEGLLPSGLAANKAGSPSELCAFSPLRGAECAELYHLRKACSADLFVRSAAFALVGEQTNRGPTEHVRATRFQAVPHPNPKITGSGHISVAGDAADRPRRADDSHRMSTPQKFELLRSTPMALMAADRPLHVFGCGPAQAWGTSTARPFTGKVDWSTTCSADLFSRSAVLPPITTKSRGPQEQVRACLLKMRSAEIGKTNFFTCS
jgi:hypothetical protein